MPTAEESARNEHIDGEGARNKKPEKGNGEG
jgi:hypothetical protein